MCDLSYAETGSLALPQFLQNAVELLKYIFNLPHSTKNQGAIS